MISIANLTDAQAKRIAEDMIKRRRLMLAHEIIRQLEARAVPAPRRSKPRKRVAKTGELA